MWSEKADRAAVDRVVLPRWLEVVFAVAIVLVGVLGWKLIIVDVWQAETDEQSIGVAQHVPDRKEPMRLPGRPLASFP